MKAPTKAELYTRIDILTRRVLLLEEELHGIGTHVIPVTIDGPYPVGHTVMVRVPRLFGVCREHP